MLRTVILAACFCALACLSSVAEARPRGRHFGDVNKMVGCSDPVMRPCVGGAQTAHNAPSVLKYTSRNRHIVPRGGGVHRGNRPRAWCGWFARFNFLHRDPGPAFNLARNWARIGSNAGGPAVGAIVVWRHHVGKIVGRANGQWIVHSGNDSNRVRTRPRSVSNAIAFRWPS